MFSLGVRCLPPPLPRYPPVSAFVLCCLSQDELRSSRPINFSNPEGVVVVAVMVVVLVMVVVVVVVAEEVKLLNADVI